MDYAEARERIRNHGNLPQPESTLPDSASFLFQLWNANRTGEVPELCSIREDIIDCLVVANAELNGAVPSETSGYQNEAVIKEFAYPMTCILGDGWKYHVEWTAAEKFTTATRDLLAECLLCISFTWEQTLAGDIDDLRQEYLRHRM